MQGCLSSCVGGIAKITVALFSIVLIIAVAVFKASVAVLVFLAIATFKVTVWLWRQGRYGQVAAAVWVLLIVAFFILLARPQSSPRLAYRPPALALSLIHI